MKSPKRMTSREMRDLPVRLSDAELLGYGDEAARALALAANAEEALLLEVKERRKQIAEQRRVAFELLRRVREKCEERPVECERVVDPGLGTLSVVRLDTGEVVSTRALTFEERQGKLFAVIQPAAKEESTE